MKKASSALRQTEGFSGLNKVEGNAANVAWPAPKHWLSVCQHGRPRPYSSRAAQPGAQGQGLLLPAVCGMGLVTHFQPQSIKGHCWLEKQLWPLCVWMVHGREKRAGTAPKVTSDLSVPFSHFTLVLQTSKFECRHQFGGGMWLWALHVRDSLEQKEPSLCWI